MKKTHYTDEPYFLLSRFILTTKAYLSYENLPYDVDNKSLNKASSLT